MRCSTARESETIRTKLERTTEWASTQFIIVQNVGLRLNWRGNFSLPLRKTLLTILVDMTVEIHINLFASLLLAAAVVAPTNSCDARCSFFQQIYYFIITEINLRRCHISLTWARNWDDLFSSLFALLWPASRGWISPTIQAEICMSLWSTIDVERQRNVERTRAGNKRQKKWNSSSRRMLSGKEFTMLVAWSLIKLVSVWMLLLLSTAHVKSALWQSGTSQLHRSCAGVEHRRRLQLLRCSRTVGYKHLLVTGYLIDK